MNLDLLIFVFAFLGILAVFVAAGWLLLQAIQRWIAEQ